MIALKVPDGYKCAGCMFLDFDGFDSRADCLLFRGRLTYRMEYGDVDVKSITKCSECPVDDNEKE